VARSCVCRVDAAFAVKVALIGGGGFRTPMVYEALASVASDVDVRELVLYDVDAARLQRISAVIEGLDRERGGSAIPVRTTTSLDEAVDGAGAVFAAVRVGGLAARNIDERVPLELGVLGQETVGPAGVSFALRTVPEMVRIAEVVRDRAPRAWFVNFTNPAGLVTEALRTVLGERAIGICDSPTALWRHAAAALGRRASSFRPSYAGLNHLGWLTAMSDGDQDVLPALLRDARAAQLHEIHLAGVDDVRSRGVVPNEYLTYYRATAAVIDAFRRHGARSEILARQQAVFYEPDASSPEETLAAWRRVKDARHSTYMAEARDAEDGAVSDAMPDDDAEAIGDGTDPDDEAGYGGVASALLRAVVNGTGERLILSVRNGTTVPWLDDDATVEVPCVVDARGATSDTVVELPEEERRLMARVRDAERATLDAVSSSSREAVVKAIACHPVVPSRELAERIVDGYLVRHAWMRERYA
jgi:6-phospho-beta-glucosidase